MGRLTLNILLSFAQFEREVTSERIRDKFAASRKKGMFMHGLGPIGYIKKDGTLIEDPEQSDKIRLIFEKYLEFESVPKLQDHLRENKIHTKTDKIFYKGHLHKMLRNKVYIGKIEYKGQVYEGLHDGIVDEEVFKNVQEILDHNTVLRNNSVQAKHSCLLSGRIFDDKGNIMSPSHSNNKYKKTYRYYISQALLQNRPQEAGTISKIPAGEMEDFVTTKITELIKNKEQVQEYLSEMPLKKQSLILKFLETYTPDHIFIRTVIDKVVLSDIKIGLLIDKSVLIQVLEAVIYGTLLNFKGDGEHILSFEYEVNISPCKSRGAKVVLGHNKIEYNLTLIQAVTKGFYYHKLLLEHRLAKELKSSSHVRRLMSLKFLPPDIIEAILNGSQDRGLTVKELYKMANV